VRLCQSDEPRGRDFSRVPVQRSCGCGCDQSPLPPDAIFRMATHGSGSEIPYRREMESAFDESFSDVRAYVGRSDPMMLLGANAATRGAQVVFRDFRPSKEVVGHELAHVVQNRRASFASGPELSHRSDPTEIEAERVGASVAAGGRGNVQSGASHDILLQRKEEGAAPGGIPPDLAAEIEKIRSRGEPSEEDLRRLGRLAVARMGPQGVAAAAKRQAVPGAERRQREARSNAGTIHRQSPGEAAAATAGTMWWLTLVDGPLPIGDIVYGALIVGAAVTAAMAGDAAIKAKCSANLEQCLESPWQPDWNKEDFGPRKDCGACYRECVHALGVWPDYKCPR
jgi:hypothetical protein